MWVGGDAIMFALMMVVFLMWSQDERASVGARSWFERARQENLATLVASQQPAAAGAAVVGVSAVTADRDAEPSEH